jgi:hypothetical protein
MALHRDIHWVGKQWAVTGYGVQACDQKQKSKFDIAADKIWEDDVLDAVRALKWLNAADFDKALSIAREHYPEPPRKARARKTTPPKETPPPRESAPPKESAAPKQGVLPLKESAPAAAPKPVPAKPQAPKSAPQKFHLRAKGSAKFLPQWRVRLRRQPR